MKHIIFHIKKITLSLKRVVFGFLMVAVLAIGGLELLIPQASKADFFLDNYAYLTNLSISQDNTILSASNSTESYQVKRRVKMIITAYSSTPEETDDTPFITASGSTVEDGIVANNLLPFGSKVRIPELYGDKVFTVQDRMNSKKGDYHLDIWFTNHSEAEKFGAELTYVEILEN